MDNAVRFIREHKAVAIISILLLIGIISFCVRPSSPVYHMIHKKAANELKETLMSEEWVCYDVYSLAGVEVGGGFALDFTDSTVEYYICPDAGAAKVDGGAPLRKKDIEFDYTPNDGKSIIFNIGAISSTSKVTFEQDGNAMILTPSITNGEKSKKWYRKSYFVEQHPEYKGYYPQ